MYRCVFLVVTVGPRGLKNVARLTDGQATGEKKKRSYLWVRVNERSCVHFGTTILPKGALAGGKKDRDL